MTEQARDATADDGGRLDLANLPKAPLDATLGIEYLEAGPERVVARMPVEGNTQPFGLLHGGASCVLAESVGSVAATLYAQPDRYAVGVDINATHHRGVREGHVTAVATPAHLGRGSASYEIVITDDTGRRVCTARLTCFLVPSDAKR
ncbi:PaaI family thioesterase [Jiangella gansuensis]|uniref:PaaI family thioesterase n=1 Tax=Jiangella gansuensis TaxID=281473 RepID=UPI0004B9CB5D|nr:hotdog fold thioesterase [Jiangella gansuensis]